MREDRTAAAVRVTDVMGNIICTTWERDHLQNIEYKQRKDAKLSCQIPAKLLRPGNYVLTALVRKITDSGKIIYEEANLSLIHI